MALDINSIRRKQAEIKAKSGGGNYFKIVKGKNIIRVFLFQHEVTKEDVKSGLFPKEKYGKTVDELDRAVTRHFNLEKRPVFSTPGLISAYKKAKAEEDKDAINKYKPSTSYFINIVNMNDKKSGMILYGAPQTVYNYILEIVSDNEYGESVLGCHGRDFVIVYDPDADGTAKYKTFLRDKDKSAKLSSDFKDKVKDIYSPEVYDTLAGKFEGDIEGEEEKKDDEVDEDEESLDDKDDPKEDSEVVEDEEDDELEDDEDEDEEDEEEEEEKPKKKLEKKKKYKK